MTVVTTLEESSATAHKPWLSATFLFIASFITMLDTTIINLALPAIQADFDAPDTLLQWTLIIYVLTFAAGLLPFGRFGDAFGRRRLFLVGLLGFLLASAACGFVPSIEALIAGRFGQGLAASMMMPQVLAILHESFPKNAKAKAVNLFGMVTALGAFAGPLVGGLLIAADLWGLGWRAIFLINLPLGVVALVGAYTVLPLRTVSQTAATDWKGAFFFALAAVALLYPIVEGRALGWPLWLIGIIALSVGSAVQLFRLQIRQTKAGAPSLLPAELLRNRRFVGLIGIVTMMFAGIAGPIVVLAIVLQSGLGMAPDRAGLALAAHPLCIMASSLFPV
ncbi:MFS transporter [Tritonibacter mobilis]|nr:MFS transporter [Tritonibacter mobilis]